MSAAMLNFDASRLNTCQTNNHFLQLVTLLCFINIDIIFIFFYYSYTVLPPVLVPRPSSAYPKPPPPLPSPFRSAEEPPMPYNACFPFKTSQTLQANRSPAIYVPGKAS